MADELTLLLLHGTSISHAGPLQVDSVEHVSWLFDRVSSIAGERLAAAGAPPPALISMCESGMGLLNLR